MSSRRANIILFVPILFGLLALTAGLFPDATATPAAPPSPASQPAPTTQPYAADSEFLSGLIGSAHDFSAGEPHPRQLCLPCHAPHRPYGIQPGLDPRPAATQPVQPYTSLGFILDESSLLCISCHDGIIASDVFTSSHASAFSNQLGASRGAGGLVGHPVGVPYPLNRRDYQPPAAVRQVGLPLPDGRVQCLSCHDPHNSNRHAGLLWISNDRSALCLACHRL